MRWIIAVAVGVLLITGCDDESGLGNDPYRDAVSDKRAPAITVSIQDNDGQPSAELAYDASNGPIPARGTTVSLQTLDDGTWSTTYSLSMHDLDGDGVVEGVPEMVPADAVSGPGPDTYPLPDLDADATYRICVDLVFRHRPQGAIGCSIPFHSDR